jgi:uncharacterized delta-60 repeat protein
LGERALKVLYALFVFVAIANTGCGRLWGSVTSFADSNAINQISSQAYTQAVLASQPKYQVGSSLGLTSQDNFFLGAYTDSACTIPATGILTATSNPVTASNGIVSFSGVSYQWPNSLEGKIYFGLTDLNNPTIPNCSSGTTIVQHFVTGQGYTLYQNGGNGISGLPNNQKVDYLWNTEEDQSGKYISMVQTTNSVGGGEVSLLRYNPDGSVDTTFGGGAGFSIFQHNLGGAAGSTPANTDDVGYVTVDSNGKYIIAGYSFNLSAGTPEIVLWRYDNNGTLDTTFGAGAGFVLFQHNGNGASGATNANKGDVLHSGAVVDSSDRYVVAGSSLNAAGTFESVIWRYNTDGSLDTTFGGTGFVIFQNNGNGAAGAPNATKQDYALATQLDSQGNIVACGRSKNAAGGKEVTIWRYTPAGVLDTTFNGVGYTFFQHNGLGATGTANATKSDMGRYCFVDSQDRIITGGPSYEPGGTPAITVWRFNQNGTLDTTFGSGTGAVTFQNGGTGGAGAADAVKADAIFNGGIDTGGNYVFAGYGNNNTSGATEPIMWRFTNAGAVDLSLNGTGTLIYSHNGPGVTGTTNATKTDWDFGFFVDSKGRYVWSGSAVNPVGGYGVVLWRYLYSGAIDL